MLKVYFMIKQVNNKINDTYIFFKKMNGQSCIKNVNSKLYFVTEGV